jgi:mevalonate pyrophosphate decarboxylase
MAMDMDSLKARQVMEQARARLGEAHQSLRAAIAQKDPTGMAESMAALDAAVAALVEATRVAFDTQRRAFADLAPGLPEDLAQRALAALDIDFLT